MDAFIIIFCVVIFIYSLRAVNVIGPISTPFVKLKDWFYSTKDEKNGE